jgi:D-aminopeptidase
MRPLIVLLFSASLFAQSSPRARDLGVPFEGAPGPLNAITDVAGVEVGHTTLISGEGKLVVGKGPVRTGVTAVLPRGKNVRSRAFAGWWTLNGNGEMTGTTWVEESGILEGPIMITNTHSVGVVRDAVIQWQVKQLPPEATQDWWSLPVVAETYDGSFNDINGFHVKPEHVFHALESAHSGVVEEGAVGGGTGMMCFQFKGGIGTASRKLDVKAGGYTVGVLVQCNFGARRLLKIAGVPVGQEITDQMPNFARAKRSVTTLAASAGNRDPDEDNGSIIIIIATDAPLLPHQLKRLAHRASLGLGRLGSISSNGSGDIFIAFSTANPRAGSSEGVASLSMVPNDQMNPLFEATIQAVEEAVVNAMITAPTMKGIDDHVIYRLPHDRLRQLLKKYNRLAPDTEH